MAKLCAWNLVEEAIENSLNKKQYASVVWCAREDLFSLFMNEYTRPKRGLVWVLVYVCVWKCFGEFIIAGATVKARNKRKIEKKKKKPNSACVSGILSTDTLIITCSIWSHLLIFFFSNWTPMNAKKKKIWKEYIHNMAVDRLFLTWFRHRWLKCYVWQNKNLNAIRSKQSI